MISGTLVRYCSRRYRASLTNKLSTNAQIFPFDVSPFTDLIIAFNREVLSDSTSELIFFNAFNSLSIANSSPRVNNFNVISALDNGSTNVNSLGFPTVGSRVIQWGWNPVGGPRGIDNPLTPSTLTMAGAVGTVTVTTT